jgi:hypothetical protein
MNNTGGPIVLTVAAVAPLTVVPAREAFAVLQNEDMKYNGSEGGRIILVCFPSVPPIRFFV